MTGTSGAPVSRASATAPGISARTTYAAEIPPSGKTQTISPSPSSRRALRYAAAGACRSTGMCRIRSIAQPTGLSQIS